MRAVCKVGKQRLGDAGLVGWKPAVDVPQARTGHVRVNLGGADAGVAEQFLDDPQVGAVLQQMGGKAVPQHVRRDVPVNAGQPHAPFDPQP